MTLHLHVHFYGAPSTQKVPVGFLESVSECRMSPDTHTEIYKSSTALSRCGDGERAIALYERMQTAKLSPANKEEGKDPLERMLLDTMDAALVGAFAAV